MLHNLRNGPDASIKPLRVLFELLVMKMIRFPGMGVRRSTRKAI